MKKISIAVCDKNESYRVKLTEYFISKKGNRVQVSSFSKQRLLLQEAKEQKFDVVLLGQGFDFTCDEPKEALYIRLAETETAQQSEMPVIFKYQPAEEILREIFLHYQQLGKEESYFSRMEKEIIGVYSPCHSRLRTPFALTMAQHFAKEGKTLYVNLGEWAGFEQWFSTEYHRDLADLLYLLQEKGSGATGMLESVVHTINGLDYIPPMTDAQLLSQTSESDYQKLLKLLVEQTDYDTIFLDFGIMVPGFFHLLEQCSHIYGVLDNGPLAQGQRQQFEAGIMKCQMQQLAERMEYISFSMAEAYLTEREAVIQQWLYGELGDRVRAIRGMQLGAD